MKVRQFVFQNLILTKFLVFFLNIKLVLNFYLDVVLGSITVSVSIVVDVASD